MTPVATWVTRGAVAGLAGGVVFGAAMLALGGALPAIAGIVGSDATALGLLVHAVVATVIGVLLGLLTASRRAGAGELVFWGMAYGTLWWLLGALTLLPWLRGEPVRWSLTAVQETFPSLVGHLAYGATAGAVLGLLGATAVRARAGRGALVRGALAGTGAGVAFAAALGAAGLLDEAGLGGDPAVRWALAVLLGGLAGTAYGVLYPRPRGALGPGLVRGLSFGFLLWLALPLTLLPVLAGAGLPWELGEARDQATALAPSLLAGVLLVVLYRVLGRLAGAGVQDDPAELADEGVGTRALQGLGRGGVGGLAGGLLFTFVLVQVDGLDRIAGLAGGSSPVVGLAVHLLIAVVLGITYGLLFRHEGGDAEAALGWGLCYGVLWWLLGNLTLLPLLLGEPVAWSAAGLADGLPSLIGHLAYGTGLALLLATLERRSNPWWTAVTPARARRAELRRVRTTDAAPGLWAVVTVLVVCVLCLAAPAA